MPGILSTKWGTLILAISIGVLATIILNYQLVLKVNSFYSDYGDYPLNGSILWYNQDSIKTGKILNQEEYFNGYQFYPQAYTLAYSDHLFVPSLIFSPIYWITNYLPLSMNIFTLTAFVLSFIASFYSINYFIKNTFASLIGAFVFTFNPLSYSHFPNHFQLMNKYFLPPLFLFAYLFLSSPTAKRAFWFFFFFTLNALSALYFQAFAFITIFIITIIYLVLNYSKPNYLQRFFKFSLISLLFLPILLYFDLPYLNFAQNERVVRTITENEFFSARLIDWILPPQNNLIYGWLFRTLMGTMTNAKFIYSFWEHTLFINILPVVLFTLGISYTKKFKATLPFLFYLLTLIMTFILTLGPSFMGLNGERGIFNMPYYYLYQTLPFLQGIRVPTRIQFLFYVPFSLFVSYGALFIIKKLPKKWLIYPVFIIMTAILLLENINPTTYEKTSEVFNNSGYLKSAGLTKLLQGKNVLHLPFYKNDVPKEAGYLNWALITHERTVNGYSGYYSIEQYNFIINTKNLDTQSINMLAVADINYIVIHKDLLPPHEWENHQARVVFEDEKTLVLDTKISTAAFKKCSLDKDFNIEVRNASTVGTNKYFKALVLKNESDCYLISKFTKKYLPFPLYINMIKYQARLKLPPVIGPYQTVVLSEIEGSLTLAQ